MPTVLDFQIRPGKDNRYPVEVFERDSSQLLAGSIFEYDLSFRTDFELSRLDNAPKNPYEHMEPRKAFGSKLYRKLFTPGIEKTWHEYKETPKVPGKENTSKISLTQRRRERGEETPKVPGKENTSKISLTQRRRERGEEKRNKTLRIYASPRLRVSAWEEKGRPDL